MQILFCQNLVGFYLVYTACYSCAGVRVAAQDRCIDTQAKDRAIACHLCMHVCLHKQQYTSTETFKKNPSLLYSFVFSVHAGHVQVSGWHHKMTTCRQRPRAIASCLQFTQVYMSMLHECMERLCLSPKE